MTDQNRGPRARHTYVITGGAMKDEEERPAPIRPSGTLTVDAAKCSGCRTCEMACSLIHEGVVIPALARLTVRHDVFHEDHPTVLVCPQCLGPECLLACPQGAIGVDEKTGARVVDEERCDGCGICVKACHLGMIHLEPRSKKAYKCDLCGGRPACVEYCPQAVISYKPVRDS